MFTIKCTTEDGTRYVVICSFACLFIHFNSLHFNLVAFIEFPLKHRKVLNCHWSWEGANLCIEWINTPSSVLVFFFVMLYLRCVHSKSNLDLYDLIFSYVTFHRQWVNNEHDCRVHAALCLIQNIGSTVAVRMRKINCGKLLYFIENDDQNVTFSWKY